MVLVYVCLQLRHFCERLVFGSRMSVSDIEPRIAIFFVSCALVSLLLSVTGERDEKLRNDKEVAAQPN